MGKMTESERNAIIFT